MSDVQIQPLMPDGRPAPALLTPEEACEFLRIQGTAAQKLRTLRYYREHGQIKGVRVGRTFSYPLKEVMKFVEESTA